MTHPLRLAALALALLPATLHAEVVGKVGVDWVGNDVLVEAIPDPKVEGVTCHIAYFERSVIDRLSQGNWFEDPSYSAVDCSAQGPDRPGQHRPLARWRIRVPRKPFDHPQIAPDHPDLR